MGNIQANDFLRMDQADRQQVQQPLLNPPNNNNNPPNVNPDNNIVHILARQQRNSNSDNNNNNDRISSGYHSLSAAVNESKSSDNRRPNITNAWNNYHHEMGNEI